MRKLRTAIFEKLSQGAVEGRTTASRGLGLRFVRMVARARGGDVAVVDTAPHGATFVLRLPLSGRRAALSGKTVATAACAAPCPHMPCTPPPGGVALDARKSRGFGVVYGFQIDRRSVGNGTLSDDRRDTRDT